MLMRTFMVAFLALFCGVQGMCNDACPCCMCKCHGLDTVCTHIVEKEPFPYDNRAAGPGHYCCHPEGIAVNNATCATHDGVAYEKYKTSCHPPTCAKKNPSETTTVISLLFIGGLACGLFIMFRRRWYLLRGKGYKTITEQTELVPAVKATYPQAESQVA